MWDSGHPFNLRIFTYLFIYLFTYLVVSYPCSCLDYKLNESLELPFAGVILAPRKIPWCVVGIPSRLLFLFFYIFFSFFLSSF